MIKVPDALPRAMDPEDVEKLLDVEGSVRDRAMILPAKYRGGLCFEFRRRLQ